MLRHLSKVIGFSFMLTFSFIPVQVSAQEKGGNKESVDSIMNPSLLKGGELLRFDRTTMNVGTLSEDDSPVTYHFHFYNISNQTLHLVRLATSCGCTVAKFSKEVIKPGEKGEIELTFNPLEQAGNLYKDTYLYASVSDKSPVAKLTLTGKVLPTSDKWRDYPFVIGNALRLKRQTFQLEGVSRENVQVERLICVNVSNKPLRLSALMLPGYVQLKTEPLVIPPDTEADLVLSIDGRMLPQKNEVAFQFILDGISARPSERTIKVNLVLQQK